VSFTFHVSNFSRLMIASIRRGLVAVIAATTLAGGFMALPAAAIAPPSLTVVSSCSGYKYFMIENTKLDCANDPATWVTVGSTGQPLNGLAYDDISGKLITMKIPTNNMYSVTLDGQATLLGSVSGIATNASVNAGDIDPATRTYYASTVDGSFYSVNLDTRVATDLTSSIPFVVGADFIIESGNLWTVDKDGSNVQFVHGFSLSNFSTLSVNFTISDTGPAGALWEDVNGGGEGLVWLANASGKIYKVSQLKTGGTTPTVVATGLNPTAPVDGATFWTLKPTNITGEAGNAQVKVGWTPSTTIDPNAIVTYLVKAYDPDGNLAGTCSYTTNTDSGYNCTVTGLTNGTLYRFTITATNQGGASETTEKGAPSTPMTTPSAPNGVTATQDNASSTVTWTVPDTDGGAAIDSYTATAYDGNGIAVASCNYTGNDIANPMSCTITGLTNGATYVIKVTATNEVGAGPPASPSSSIVPGVLPDAPNNVSLSTSSSAVTITWTIPDSDGGAAIDSYTATAYDGNGNVVASCSYSGNNPTGAMSCEISGLTTGDAYTFKVTAHNRVGDGPPSSPAGPIVVGSLACVPGEQIAMANGQFFQSTDLSTWTAIGSQQDALNAIGYSPIRGFVYGLYQKGPRKGGLVRVDAGGIQKYLGRVTGLPKETYLAGDIDTATGFYYVSTQNHRLFQIDLSTRAATEIMLPDAFPSFGADLVIENSVVWTVAATKVWGLNLNTGDVSYSWLPRGSRFLKIGGLALASNGDFIGLSNQNGQLYRFSSFGTRHTRVTVLDRTTDGNPNGLDVDLATCTVPV